MKIVAKIWLWLYPRPAMFVDSTYIDYYHRSVERKMHWSERTDLKPAKKFPLYPCQ